MDYCRPLFLYFRLFNTVDSKRTIYFLPMTRFEQRSSGVGSDRSSTWATTDHSLNWPKPLPNISNFNCIIDCLIDSNLPKATQKESIMLFCTQSTIINETLKYILAFNHTTPIDQIADWQNGVLVNLHWKHLTLDWLDWKIWSIARVELTKVEMAKWSLLTKKSSQLGSQNKKTACYVTDETHETNITNVTNVIEF